MPRFPVTHPDVFYSMPGTVIIRCNQQWFDGLPYAEGGEKLDHGMVASPLKLRGRPISIATMLDDLKARGYGCVSATRETEGSAIFTRLRFVLGGGQIELSQDMCHRLRYTLYFGATAWANRLRDGGRLDVVNMTACNNLRPISRQAKERRMPIGSYRVLVCDRDLHPSLIELGPVYGLRFTRDGSKRYTAPFVRAESGLLAA